MTTLAKLRREIVERLKPHVDEKEEREREAALFMESATGLNAAELALRADEEASLSLVDSAEVYLQKRSRRVPPQYCLGKAWFMGLVLAVRQGVFIPRADSETLVAVSIEKLNENGVARPRIAEIGSGSGAISVALLRAFPEAVVTAVDVSPAALDLTLHNAKRHSVESRLTLIQADFRRALSGSFDIVVSNPPYIPRSEKENLSPEVKDYEPEEALFGWGDDGLGFYRDFAALPQAKFFADGKGIVVFECGDGQSAAVAEILEGCGFSQITVHRDMNGLARVVAAELA